MKNIILFGPPGIGKSTIIGTLKSKGIGAIDLEDLYPNRIRFQIPAMVEGKVLGAADLNPKRKYSKALKVLLIAEQDVYDKRRAARDARVAGKGNQQHHDVSAWMDADYDMIIDTSKLSVDKTADTIISYLKEGAV